MDESGLLYGIWQKHKGQKPQVGHSSVMLNLRWINNSELSGFWSGSSWNGKPDGYFSNNHFRFCSCGFNFGCRIRYYDSEEKEQNNNSNDFTLTSHLKVCTS